MRDACEIACGLINPTRAFKNICDCTLHKRHKRSEVPQASRGEASSTEDRVPYALGRAVLFYNGVEISFFHIRSGNGVS